MAARLFIHLGPPKTGTTALQLALERLVCSKFLYGGKYNLDGTRKYDLSKQLYEFSCANDVTSEIYDHMVNDIANKISQDVNVIISDEMFLMPGGLKEGIARKIEALGRLSKRIPVSVIVTARSPKEGLPSLYQHEFNWLPLSQRISLKAFCESERAKAFDYGAIEALLIRSGITEIHAIDFAELATGSLDLSLLVKGEPSADSVLKIGQENVSQKVGDGFRSFPSTSLHSLGRQKFVQRLLALGRLRQSKFTRKVIEFSKKIQISKSSGREVRLPRELVDRLELGYRDFLAKYGYDRRRSG